MDSNLLPLIDLQLCNRCNDCVSKCPEDALVMNEQGPVFKHPVTCTYCTDCEAVCPTGAIRVPLTVAWGL